jgi:hypothetical protein
MFLDEFDGVDELDAQLLKQQKREQERQLRMRNGQAPPQDAPEAPQDAPEAPQQAPREAFGMHAYSTGHSGYEPSEGHPSNDLGGMIDRVTGAIRRENYSRVVQAREAQARQHERDVIAMQQDALLQRLAAEQRERERDRILQKQLTTGVTTSVFDGGWQDV